MCGVSLYYGEELQKPKARTVYQAKFHSQPSLTTECYLSFKLGFPGMFEISDQSTLLSWSNTMGLLVLWFIFQLTINPTRQTLFTAQQYLWVWCIYGRPKICTSGLWKPLLKQFLVFKMPENFMPDTKNYILSPLLLTLTGWGANIPVKKFWVISKRAPILLYPTMILCSYSFSIT